MRRFATGLCAALLLWGHEAAANGRFPAANQLVLGPQRALARVTFGLLISDNGGPFSWVCEPAIPLSDDQDPPVALFSGGRAAVAPLDGLRASDEAACGFALVQGIPANELLIDVSAERNDPSRGVALTWQTPGKMTRVYGTEDGGKVWNLRGELPETDGVPTTLDAAPSKPARLAVAGAFSKGLDLWGYVSVSDDGGESWSRSETPLTGGEKGIFLSAIDPEDPDLLYFRTSGGAGDRLLVSSDGGKTLAELTRVDGAMLGFALSPDGAKIAIGGPNFGVKIGARGAAEFTTVRKASTSCLAWGEQGLHACGSGLAGDFVLGRSTDDGASWQPLLARLGDVASPEARCGADSAVAATCGPLWPEQQKLLSAIGQGGATGAAGSGGQGGAGSGGAGPADAGQGGGVQAPEGEGDCGCRGAGRPASAPAAAGLALGLALARRRRGSGPGLSRAGS